MSNSNSNSTRSCEDCGNKAKRDCIHMRCRTCCKSRGFQCSTHVKSTWVPVARRRQKHHLQHLQLSSSTVDHHHHYHLNLPLSLSNLHPPHTPPSTGIEGGNFPAEVNSLATFRCIRVSSDDNVVDQYGYQTAITVGGHVFRGILYDQGPTTATRGGGGGGDSSSAGTSIDNQPYNITTTTTTATATMAENASGNLLYHPPSLYSAPTTFNAFFPGMQFFPHPRP